MRYRKESLILKPNRQRRICQRRRRLSHFLGGWAGGPTSISCWVPQAVRPPHRVWAHRQPPINPGVGWSRNAPSPFPFRSSSSNSNPSSPAVSLSHPSFSFWVKVMKIRCATGKGVHASTAMDRVWGDLADEGTCHVLHIHIFEISELVAAC